MSRKTVAKSLADGIVQLAIPSVLIHKDNQYNDSETKNSLKRFTKKLEIGPAWELKSNAVADLFVMIIAWANKKA